MLWETIINLLASSLEILGAFLMANAYLNVAPLQLPTMMVNALWRGEKAKDAVAIADIVEEKRIVTLQGLSFIAAGFILKSIPVCIALFHQTISPASPSPNIH
jgi:hypothetical protein